MPELLERATEEAAGLLGADGAFLYLRDPATGMLRLTHTAGVDELTGRGWLHTLELPAGVGMFGRSVEERRVLVTGDYPNDASFVHAGGPDRVVEEVSIRSMVVAPLVSAGEVFGALGTFSRELDAFTAPQVALVRALADHAAIAMANARLIGELDRSRAALARQADVERSLRELGTRISGAREPEAVVQFTIDEALRLLDGEGARIDIVDTELGLLRGMYSSGQEQIAPTEWPEDTDDRLEVGASGRAVTTGETYITGDYLSDTTIVHGRGPDTYARNKGISSVIATPLFGDHGPFGAITVWSTRRDAFGPTHGALLETIAGQGAVALGRARLIEELGRSREALARRAEEERTLREIARRLMAIQDPAELLQDVVDEAARLLGSSGAVIDLLDPATGEAHWAHDAGIDDATREEWVRRAAGVDGVVLAIRERRVVVTDDYAADRRFPDGQVNQAFLERAGIRSIAFAPMVGEAVVLGTLAVFAGEAGRFGEQDAALLGALADLATIAIQNAELIAELARSREETARRAETERTLREIAARVTSIRDPEAILGLIVDEARRVLGSDGAHLTRMSEDGTFLRPVVITGEMNDASRDWLRTQEFPIDGGINGLAAGQGRVVWTPNYATDPRIPRDEDDLQVADRMGLGAMAAAPLRSPGGEVIGTLAVSYRASGAIAADQLATLQALADHAAIALSNSDLLARLEASESSYRRLVQATPDVIWRNDGEGRFTFVAEGAEALFGWRPDELVGRHFSYIVAPESMPDAGQAWQELASTPDAVWRMPFVLRRSDGSTFPSEVSAVTSFDDGVFTGAQGTLRDVSERERLERELRASEERYRFLVENSPDVVFSADAEGRFTYVSESIQRLTGFTSAELVGQPFSMILTEDSIPIATERWTSPTTEPGLAQVLRLELRCKGGTSVPVEIHSIGVPDSDDRFAGVHGSARDIGERERLERELRESEERYRSVIQSSPDLIWATNRSGRYVFVSDRVRDLLGWEPEEVLGRPFRDFIDQASVDSANDDWTRLAGEPGRTRTQRLDLRHRDGSIRPFEVSSVAVVRDGQVENVYGIARDIAERERLEGELRESEERYRFLVENSPDVIYATDAAGQITYFSESVERVLGWTPAEVIGRHFRDIIRTDGEVPVGQRFAELARGMPDLTTRMELLDRTGVYRPFEVTAAAIRRDGAFAGVHGSARDIGERERLERELRDSEERYRYLVQSSPDLVWMTDDEGRFTFVSDQAQAILGWEPEELLGRSFADIAPPEGRRGALARFRYLQRRPTEAHRSRLKVLSRDGRELSMEITGIGMVGDGRFLGAHGAARDVSERDRLERDLRRQAAELASSEERAHLARELHDSVTQALFSMTLLSRSAELLLQKDPSQVPEKLASLRELQRDALAEMRALIFELRPGNIEENGLIQALRTHSAALSGRIGLPVVVESDLPERPPIEVEETLYRIAQEALHNVVKHAGARQVTLDVCRVADGVRLRVMDDGRGFDPAAVPDGHLGLAGMQSRAERLGGRLLVTTAVGVGTTIEVVVPEVRGVATSQPQDA